jgi:hypothetical protein
MKTFYVDLPFKRSLNSVEVQFQGEYHQMEQWHAYVDHFHEMQMSTAQIRQLLV